MTDETRTGSSATGNEGTASGRDQSRDHARRAGSAFESWYSSRSEQLSKEDEERMLGIRHAVESGDRATAERHLAETREHSGWLYDELMKHPEISAILRELSIMGF